MTYREVGQHLSNEFELSKFTIWKIIHDTIVEAVYSNEINRDSLKIHLQIDEKYIGVVDSTNKKRYYTATIFAGKSSKGQLLNKTVLSSSNLTKLKERINYHLLKRYKVKIDEEIFISGDFAGYIQNLEDYIIVCKAKYVPDKFHVYKTIKDSLPGLYVDDYSINQSSFKKHIVKELKANDDLNAKKLSKLLICNPSVFKTYLDPEYLGCSQEGQNSHIYAPRFGKYANRFSKETIEKLSLIREARAMNCNIRITSINRDIPEKIDIGIVEYDFSKPLRQVLDTSKMKYETMKMFDAIKYGNN